MSDMSLEQHDTSLETMQVILEAQKRAYLAEGEVSYATRFDRLERAINVVRKNEKRFVEALHPRPDGAMGWNGCPVEVCPLELS